MKYLTGLILFMLAHIASAAECQVNGSRWTDPLTHGYNAYVDVRASTSIQKILLNYYVMNCRHGQPLQINPYLEVVTDPDAVQFSPQYSHLQGGLVTAADTYYPTPVRAGYILGMQRAEPYTSVVGGPYLNITTTPGNYINIQAGSLIAVVKVRIRLSDITGSGDFPTFVNVYARNSLNLSPSTCTINNNDPIDVDFGSVDPVAIGGEIPAGTPYRQSVALNYSCPDAGIFTPIDIKLVGTASSFNSSALATSNPNLATAMIRLSSLVPPGGSFRTSINNSSGGDTVLFSLFRKTGSLPGAGPFTGSATLVMSVP